MVTISKQTNTVKFLNITCIFLDNKIVGHSDVVGASPVSAAPTISSFSTKYQSSKDRAKLSARLNEKYLSFGMWCTFN